jgi:hypothetical protein
MSGDRREKLSGLIQQHLHRAVTRMKLQADKSRSERCFAVGDLVFLKLQPYVQSSLTRRSNQKLNFKYFGHFAMLQRVGSVASWIFHLNLLYTLYSMFLS